MSSLQSDVEMQQSSNILVSNESSDATNLKAAEVDSTNSNKRKRLFIALVTVFALAALASVAIYQFSTVESKPSDNDNQVAEPSKPFDGSLSLLTGPFSNSSYFKVVGPLTDGLAVNVYIVTVIAGPDIGYYLFFKANKTPAPWGTYCLSGSCPTNGPCGPGYFVPAYYAMPEGYIGKIFMSGDGCTPCSDQSDPCY